MLNHNFLRKIIVGSAGFTLMEVVVALGLLSLAITMVGNGIFQTIHADRFWQDDVVATRDLRHALSWFAGDALSTKTTDLVDGDPAVDTVMLTTYIGDEITYSVNLNDELIRSHWDGSVTTQHPVATGVDSVSFLLLSDVLTVTLVVRTDGTNTKTLSLDTKLR